VGDRNSAIGFFNAAMKATEDKSYPNWATHCFQLFQSACLVDPKFGKGQYQNGQNCGDLNRLEAAVACYRRALDGDLDTEDRIRALSNMSWRLHQLGELEDALKFAQMAVDAGPQHSYGWVNLSVAHGAYGQRMAAVSAARKALELTPDDMTVQFCLAFALLFNEDYQEGFKFFEARFPTRLQQYLTYPYPKWLGEPDKTVFLVADQGLGDTLSFSRFIDAASKKAKYIHAMVQPTLLRTFNEAFVHLPNVNFIPSSTGFPEADVWTTFVSLPFALGLSNEEIKSAPHPKLPVYGVSDVWKVPDTKFHIGVTWGGSPKNDIDRWRSFPMKHLLDLYKVPGVQLYSLQMDDHRKELEAQCCESVIRDLSPWISDITDTVAILQHLDLVVTCESALAHIAGAIGKEVWIPYSYHAHDYRLGHDGSAILWYKNHRLFHQGRDRLWEKPFAEIVEALWERTEQNTGKPTILKTRTARRRG